MKTKKLVLFLAIPLIIYSCVVKKKSRDINCIVTKIKIEPKNSIHEEINPTRYRVETDCGKFFTTRNIYQEGDTVKMTIVSYE